MRRFPTEDNCFAELMNPGSLLRIEAPKKMGKSSLMLRLIDRAGRANCKPVLLHFRQVDSHRLADLNALLRWFCANVARGLDLDPKL